MQRPHLAVVRAATPAAAQTAAAADPSKPTRLAIANKARTGGFEWMLERQMIRVAVPYGGSLSLADQGRERGPGPARRFENIGGVPAESIGIETTTRVRHIDKHRVSHRLILEVRASVQKPGQQLVPAKS